MNGEINHTMKSIFTDLNPDDAAERITQIESLCVNCGLNVSRVMQIDSYIYIFIYLTIGYNWCILYFWS